MSIDTPHHEAPSVLSTLPVALVVEQTARILEEIKRKIQLQKEEEERLKMGPVRAPSDEGIFNPNTTKSFIILPHRYSDSAAPSNTISPLNITSFATSLSPDSGTDYEPFSASSSISPPFLSSTKRETNSSAYDVMKLSHNSDDEIFKPLSNYSPFVPLMLPPNLKTFSPTTSLSPSTNSYFG